MKRSIITRLYIGFAVAIVLVLAVGVTSYQATQHGARSGQWVNHTYQVMNTVKSVQATIPKMRSSLKNYFITGEEQFRLPYDQGKNTIIKETDDLKKLVIDNPEQLQRADTLIAGIENLVFFWSAARLTDTLSRDAMRGIMMAEQAKVDSLNNTIERIYSAEQHLLAQREQEDEDAATQSADVLIAGTTLILIIVFILIYFILREFNQRTTAEDSLKKSIGDVTALNELADKRNWQLTGTAKINDSLQGKTTTANIIHNVLNSITQYLEVPAAAFYIIDEAKEMLQLKGSVGITVKNNTSFNINQMPGGIPAYKEIRVITDVPADFWQVQSGMGASLPNEIVVAALYFGDELKGIIELAAYKNFSSEKITLLQAAADNIAVALNTAQAGEKVMQLLEQVQEQKEILENQQEELRQSNEELVRQTEVLQASEEELKVQEEELRHINTELEEKNEAVEMARQALQAKAKELDEISRYKSEFLANMSHELRTPLNSVLILATLLADNKNNNLTEKQVEYAGIIHKSGTDLLNLINDILDLSKIEAGKIDIHIEEVAVKDIVTGIIPPFEVLADNKKINFVTIVDEDVPQHITTDKLRLEQIIKNLLSNSFKFTGQGGTITLQCFMAVSNLNSAEKTLGISVKDTGVGIASGQQHLIFEAFQQADGSTSRKYGGTGLGLSISRHLARILGGEITVSSEQGIGSTFTIYIPLQLSAPVIKLPLETVKKMTAPENMHGQTAIQDERDDIQQSDKVMLIIEDDVKFAAILQGFARDRNYKTIIALSGDEGLVCAGKYMPTAIILDIQLPVLDGWSILKALKKNDKLRNIPVHIISVSDAPDGKAEGAFAYLKKPVTKETLDKAFNDIDGYIESNFKKILFFCPETGKNDALQKLLGEHKMDVAVTYVNTLPQAVEALKKNSYNCMIVDIGTQINTGIQQLTQLKETGVLTETQVIIYLDKDISKDDEWELKKISSIVIRDSGHANQRLIDELDLFLYKVQQTQKKPFKPTTDTITDDNVLAGKKVLIVDDDMRNVFALNVALEEYKMTVCTANDGKEALEVLKANKDTAIVLMDIMMPEMDGYDAIRNIRNTMRLTTLPVIALTAKAMQGDREKSIDAGASDYITKPVDISRLLSLMRVWLSQ